MYFEFLLWNKQFIDDQHQIKKCELYNPLDELEKINRTKEVGCLNHEADCCDACVEGGLLSCG